MLAPPRPATLAEARAWLDTLTPADLSPSDDPADRLRLRPHFTVCNRARFLAWLRGGLARLGPDGRPVPASWRAGAKRDARVLFDVLYYGAPRHGAPARPSSSPHPTDP